MSDPTLSDIDFKNKMAWVCTTLNFESNKYLISRVLISYLLYEEEVIKMVKNS